MANQYGRRLVTFAISAGAIVLALVATQTPSQAATGNVKGASALGVSEKSDRSNARLLDGTSLSGTKWIYVQNPTDVSKVLFFLDQPDFATLHRTENFKPFDLEGTKADGNAQGLDTTSLKDGKHNLAAVLLGKGQSVKVLRATFRVNNVRVGNPTTTVPGKAGSLPIRANLTGAAEFPTAGDPDGSGTIIGDIDLASNTFCYGLALKNVDTITAAHIHRGVVGTEGPVVADLLIPVKGSSSNEIDACSPIPADVVQRIAANPANYYANVHTTAFPKGAMRGQLGA